MNNNVAVNSVLNMTKARSFYIGLLVAMVYSEYVVVIELGRYIVYTFLPASPFRLEHL
jgi:hypothetical protein